MREQQLNLPAYDVRMSEKDGRQTIFDFLRNRYVALTPEEWVRQHFTHFLVEHKGYPKGLLANETELRVGSKRLRCDTVLYDQSLRPRMIIEYKAPHIKLWSTIFCCMQITWWSATVCSTTAVRWTMSTATTRS